MWKQMLTCPRHAAGLGWAARVSRCPRAGTPLSCVSRKTGVWTLVIRSLMTCTPWIRLTGSWCSVVTGTGNQFSVTRMHPCSLAIRMVSECSRD